MSKPNPLDEQIKIWATWVGTDKSVPIDMMKKIIGEYEKMRQVQEAMFAKCLSCNVPITGVYYYELPMKRTDKNGTVTNMIMGVTACQNPICRKVFNTEVKPIEKLIKL